MERRRSHGISMKASEADILIVPGWGGSGPHHWQSRWQSKLSTARRVEQADWDNPDRDLWVETIERAVAAATRPVVLVAHSLGVAAARHVIARDKGKIIGALLVAPPDFDHSDLAAPHLAAFGPYPREPLPFPAILVASQNDHYGSYDHAGDLANAWGALLLNAGEAGHINAESGHGPWPEGTMVFAQYLSRLKA
ncbi:MAG: hypothetical protein RLZZ444_1663 [Pseudomonadota bacterium]